MLGPMSVTHLVDPLARPSLITMVFSQSIEMHYNAKKKTKPRRKQMLIELGSLPKAVCRDLEVLFFIYIGKLYP
jgi:hypothetical protein